MIFSKQMGRVAIACLLTTSSEGSPFGAEGRYDGTILSYLRLIDHMYLHALLRLPKGQEPSLCDAWTGLKNENFRLTADKKSLEGQVASISSQASLWEKSSGKFERQLSDVTRKNETLGEQILHLKREEEALRQNVLDFTDAKERMERSRADLENNFSILKLKKEESEHYWEVAKEALKVQVLNLSGDKNGLEGDLSDLQKELNLLKNANDALQDQVSALGEEKEEEKENLAKVEEELELLRGCNSELQNRVLKLTADNRDLEDLSFKRTGEVEQLKNLNEELGNQLSILAVQREESELSWDVTRGELHAKNSHLTEDLNLSRDEISKLSEENGRLSPKVIRLKTKKGNLKRDVSRLVFTEEVLKKRRDHLEERLLIIESDLQSSRGSNGELEDRFSEQLKELENSLRSNKELEESVLTLNHENILLERTNKTLEERITQFFWERQRSVSLLNDVLITASDVIERDREDISRLMIENQDLELDKEHALGVNLKYRKVNKELRLNNEHALEVNLKYRKKYKELCKNLSFRQENQDEE